MIFMEGNADLAIITSTDCGRSDLEFLILLENFCWFDQIGALFQLKWLLRVSTTSLKRERSLETARNWQKRVSKRASVTAYSRA